MTLEFFAISDEIRDFGPKSINDPKFIPKFYEGAFFFGFYLNRKFRPSRPQQNKTRNYGTLI